MEVVKEGVEKRWGEMMKWMGKEEDGKEMKMGEREGIEVGKGKIEEIGKGLWEWVEEEWGELKEGVVRMYKGKLKCLVGGKYEGWDESFGEVNVKGVGRGGMKRVYG